MTADLETVAIERGLVRDPEDAEIAGLYVRDIERLCVVPNGFDYRVGATLDYGGGVGCAAGGTLSRAGDTLTVELGGNGCSFDANYDGERISFPGTLPEECAAFCTGSASLAGMRVTLLSDSAAEARALRSPNGTRLCPGED